MRAVRIPRTGGPEVLEAVDLPVPEPGPGEVAVDVAFAGVNYVDVMFRRGDVGAALPLVPGVEVSGRVRALGEGVEGLRVGQPVAASTPTTAGGYAEVVVAPAPLAFPLDGEGVAVDLATAAASQATIVPAYLAVSEVAQLREGEDVLVHGAAGGLGGVLGRVARALGAGRVFGAVSTPRKAGYARTLGYDEVLLNEGFVEGVARLTGGRGADVILDGVGGDVRARSLDALAPLGRLVVMGNASNAPDVPQSSLGLWFSNKAVLGCGFGPLWAAEPEGAARVAREAMERLVLRGEVTGDVTDVLGLEEAAEAHRRVEGRAVTGKLVLRVADRDGAGE